MSLLRNVLTYMGLGPDEDYDDGYRYDADDARGSDGSRAESDERSTSDPHAPRERPRSLDPQRAVTSPTRSERPARTAPVEPHEPQRTDSKRTDSTRADSKRADPKQAGSKPGPKQTGSKQVGSKQVGSKADPKRAASTGAAPGAEVAAGGTAGADRGGAERPEGAQRLDLRTKSAQSRPLRAVPPAELGIQTDLVQPENGLTVRAVAADTAEAAEAAEAEMASDSAAAGSAPHGRRQVPPRLLSPASFGDAKTLADDFMSSVPVVMNLRGVERDLARRLIDFASGICYALEGTMEKMAPQVFLLSPRSVEVSQEDRRRMAQRNYES